MSKNISNCNVKSPFLYDLSDKEIPEFEGIPILIRNYESIKSHIKNATQSIKKDWYESPQETVWTGPYRHHLLKRKKYIESVLTKYTTYSSIEMFLDLGCGDGENFSWLKPYIENLYGSDYNINRLIRAKNKNIAKEIVLADITDYPAHSNSFDVIFFNHVLEHIPDDEKALSEVFRILKKGGICILGVPNEGALWWQLAYKLQPETLKTTDHVHFYTIKSLSEKLRKHGFQIKEIKSLGWGLPHWSLDSMVRGYKFVDDIFEFLGKIFIPHQASSLYFIIEK